MLSPRGKQGLRVPFWTLNSLPYPLDSWTVLVKSEEGDHPYRDTEDMNAGLRGILRYLEAFLVAQMVKNLPAMQEIWV